ncbi:hypothetical protein M407DRAFT_29155 [Tulasnella calospora MUT 4182]|uniref:Uncharacterized protein n=1 Tax=Tulasnella calospora MUT 4182 TaxID=1051891 RepID=A0A0C3QAM0_9AGAM|nr:hypothetical protein M407DRAFT_29155 [Tulasnella calospora MUT 4182]
MNTTQLLDGPYLAEQQWWLPDFIQRYFDIPAVPPVQSSTLVLLDPNHLGRTVPEIRSLLRENGVRQVYSSSHLLSVSANVGSVRDSFINGLRAFLPETHSVKRQARIITLVQSPEPSLPFTLPDSAFILEGSGFFPFHAVLMAAYCSRIEFDIPPKQVDDDNPAPDQRFDIRFTRLSFGNEMVMACFREWLYRQDCNMLRPAILPSSPSLPPTPPFEILRQDPEKRRQLSQDISSSHSELILWNFVLNVLDFRRLMTMLGVDDERIWTSLSLAWEILLDALNLCCITRAAEDESRGLNTSGAREILKRGLGLFDNPPGLRQP